MYQRCLNIPALLKKKSLLLFGPRQVGKSTLVQQSVSEGSVFYNLAEADVFRELSANPELLRQRLSAETKTLVIDEAQRIPELFDEVQVLIDRNPELRVVLTGSSARKLRRTGINLLPGRIWQRRLFPLITNELGQARIEERAVRGALPGIIDSEDFKEELLQYVGNYLDEEVRAEGLVRGIGGFSRFLTVAATANAEQLNFTSISNDAGVHLNTVRSFFDILEDTLIATKLVPFRKGLSRKVVATPKFYFFDCGVVNALLRRFELPPGTEAFGKAFEHIVFQELVAYLSYTGSDQGLSYWRTHSQQEVDFLIGDAVAIEVKASSRVVPSDEKGLRALEKEMPLRHKVIVCRESVARRSDSGVMILPIKEFLTRLWAGEYLS